MNTEHNLEVARECGFHVYDKSNNSIDTVYAVDGTDEALDAYTTRILAEKEAEKNVEIECLAASCRAVTDKIFKANALIAMKDEALCCAVECFECENDLTELTFNRMKRAISTTSESAAAWEEAKFKPLQQQVAMLREALESVKRDVVADNEAFLEMHTVNAIDEALSATSETTEAFLNEVRANVMADLATSYRNSVRIYGGNTKLADELDAMALELRAKNGG